MKHNFLKAAAATPSIKLADCAYNAAQIIACAEKAAKQGVELLVTPELGLTGYTCGDLFMQNTLQTGAVQALQTICEKTAGYSLILLVGLPVVFGGKLYNVAAVLQSGKVLGLVPKTHLPNYSEFYELRHFSPAPDETYLYNNNFLQNIPFGTNLLFSCKANPLFTFGVEICEDLWVPCPPSVKHALAGATVIANLSAGCEVVGKAEYRRSLVMGQSGRLCCSYIYANAGEGESTADVVYAGHNMIAEHDVMLAETLPFSKEMAVAEIDLERLAHERNRKNTFPPSQNGTHQTVFFEKPAHSNPNASFSRYIPQHPFIPEDPAALNKACETTLTIQATGLAARLRHINASSVVLGLSGGLDSTLALLVAMRAMHILDRPANDILAVTMPAFGTTQRTRGNAKTLAEVSGVTLQTVDISSTVRSHFADIGHNEDEHSLVYENAQARMRTLVLMDIANQKNGIVVGTGDLSELALGWATYNGDHMSMYGANASVPKTLVRYLVEHEADRLPKLAKVLHDILNTPVSPELLPAVDGEISQQTEDLVGPYELHDFFLYYMLRWGFSPTKILFLAEESFREKYPRETILKWMKVFYKRFFAQQFKRSCLPDGPKVGSVSLSPRGDWRMPSDASAALWLSELQAL